MNAGSLDGYRLEWLTSFLAVVDYGGFSAAADSTYRTQPRISAHIAGLERHLGAVLFDRRDRPVRLTEAGVAFLEPARRVLHALETGTSSVQAVLGLLHGTVRLGWYPSAGAAFGPVLLKEFSESFPGVNVTLVETSTSGLALALQTGDADVAIRPVLPRPREASIRHHVLWEEPLVAVLSESHPLASSDYISLSELALHPIITIGGATSDNDNQHEIHSALMSAGVTPLIAFNTDEPQTLVSLAREGIGVGLTNLLAATISNTAGTKVIPLRDAGNRRQVGVFWDSTRPMQPASRALIDLIVQLPVPEAVQSYQRGA